MEEFTDIDSFKPGDDYPGSAFVLGRFDGVHLGHMVLLERAIAAEKTYGLKSVCFSFQECSYPGASKRGVLTTADEKALILSKLGIDYLIHPVFGPPIVDLSPEEFVKDLLIGQWKAKLIIAGYDFHFGKDRAGDSEFLKSEGGRLGAIVDIVNPVTNGSEIVKATNIRELLHYGDVAQAGKLLGRPYFVHVQAKKGRGLGKEFGFPTINFGWPQFKVKLPAGIYAVRIKRNDDDPISYSGVANFGTQPTIDESNRLEVLEVHVLEGIDKLEPISEGSGFRVDFIDHIRAESKFSSIEELKAQIGRDCDKASEILTRTDR